MWRADSPYSLWCKGTGPWSFILLLRLLITHHTHNSYCCSHVWQMKSRQHMITVLTRTCSVASLLVSTGESCKTKKKKSCEVVRLLRLQSEVETSSTLPKYTSSCGYASCLLVMGHQHEHSDLHSSTSHTVIRHQCKHTELNNTMSWPVGPVMLIASDPLPHKPVGFWCSA